MLMKCQKMWEDISLRDSPSHVIVSLCHGARAHILNRRFCVLIALDLCYPVQLATSHMQLAK